MCRHISGSPVPDDFLFLCPFFMKYCDQNCLPQLSLLWSRRDVAHRSIVMQKRLHRWLVRQRGMRVSWACLRKPVHNLGVLYLWAILKILHIVLAALFLPLHHIIYRHSSRALTGTTLVNTLCTWSAPTTGIQTPSLFCQTSNNPPHPQENTRKQNDQDNRIAQEIVGHNHLSPRKGGDLDEQP